MRQIGLRVVRWQGGGAWAALGDVGRNNGLKNQRVAGLQGARGKVEEQSLIKNTRGRVVTLNNSE